MGSKTFLDIDVFTAAKARIETTVNDFKHV
jgi:hypothetical protein